MAKRRTVRLWHAETAGNVPATIAQGELGPDALSDPPHLWTGVPTTRDPSGRVDLLADIALLKARVAALEADMRYTGWRSRLPPEPLAAPLTSGPLPAPMSGSAPAGNVRSAPMSASAPAAHVRSDAPLQSSSVAGSTVGVVARKKPRAKRKNGGNKR